MHYKNILFALTLSGLAFAQETDDCCCEMTEVSYPCFSGGFYLEGSWQYLRPIATDGDLEYGSFITLTIPPNLNALLLEVKPSYQSGYELALGYRLPCSNQALTLDYFSIHFSDHSSKDIETINELIQNFLGASYSTANANSKQKIDQVDLSYRLNYCIDQTLDLQPYLGISYADIRRKLHVKFTDLVYSATPANLKGIEKSTYWGVGPFFGTQFLFPIWNNFALTGNVEAGVLFGKVKSKLSSQSFRDNATSTFFSSDHKNTAVTVLFGDLALVYGFPLFSNWGLDIKLGYTTDYYFKPIERIDPYNGYVINQDTFPVKQSSNLGLGGLYVLVSLNQSFLPYSCQNLSCCPLWDGCDLWGPYFQFTSSWLAPTPTNKDLVYATLNTAEGKQKNLQVYPDTTWASSYELGWNFSSGNQLQFTYFHLDTKDHTSTKAKAGETISSVNASGPSFVVFSESQSKVKYRLDQIDGMLGKSMQLFCHFNLTGSFGLRYAELKRKISNDYFGGEPPLITQSKFPFLKSRFDGIGPIFSIKPEFSFWNYFGLTGKLNLAFLGGNTKATLDQDNFGMIGETSNTLRTPNSPFIVPVFDGSAGLQIDFSSFNCLSIHLEGGYQYSAYYRAVRLLLPTFLTGLEQINSNFILLGPYFTVGINSSF